MDMSRCGRRSAAVPALLVAAVMGLVLAVPFRAHAYVIHILGADATATAIAKTVPNQTQDGPNTGGLVAVASATAVGSRPGGGSGVVFALTENFITVIDDRAIRAQVLLHTNASAQAPEPFASASGSGLIRFRVAQKKAEESLAINLELVTRTGVNSDKFQYVLSNETTGNTYFDSDISGFAPELDFLANVGDIIRISYSGLLEKNKGLANARLGATVKVRAAVIPEPATSLLGAVGLGGLGWLGRRRISSSDPA